ncbi:MAG TPA: type III pantothenate kinase [bacterium]|nr:type III pantothenate kinase [bacterium]
MDRSLLLAVNANNTLTKIGVYRRSDLLHHWRISSETGRTADELAVLLRSLFDSAGTRFDNVGGVAISSVVPALLDTLVRLARDYFHITPLVAGPDTQTGMRVLYENPRDVGADRICAAVAAYAKYGGPAIAVDLGTATTFSVVSREGDFLGGAIAPGIGISVDALAEHAAQLHRIPLEAPRTAIGRSTTAAMQAGIVFGFVGLVNDVVRRIREELGAPAVTVATGGWADLVVPECTCIDHHDPLLVLEGLRLIYEQSRQATRR